MRTLVMSAMSLALCGAAAGQIDRLYTIGNSGWNNPGTGKIIQGGTVLVNFNTQTQSDSALAVISTIRTMGRVNDGKEYDLNGNYLGNTYAAMGYNFYDGTTDGTYNYGVNYSSQVIRTDLNWNNPTLLIDGLSNVLGITVDQSDGTVWTHGFDGMLSQYSNGGQLQSQYNTGQGGLASLAYEPSSDSFWLGGASATLVNVNKTGGFIQSISPQGYAGCAGMEFGLVPAPGAGVLLGVSGIIAGRRRR